MKPFSLNISGKLTAFTQPAIMGVLNVTPDSLYAESRKFSDDEVLRRVAQLINEGADIIDIGGYSTRPGFEPVPEDEEMRRVELGLAIMRRVSETIPVSIDTFNSSVARMAVTDYGANMINDVSMGLADNKMFATVADLQVPYILTHNYVIDESGAKTPRRRMFTAEVIAQLSEPLHRLAQLGAKDVIIDPGFGFSKTLEESYELFGNLDLVARMLQRPIMVGISRKRMITEVTQVTPEEALPGTVALNTIAVLKGASILRVHDVAAARQALDVITHIPTN